MSSLYLAPAKQSTPLSFGEGHGVRLLKKLGRERGDVAKTPYLCSGVDVRPAACLRRT